MHPTPTAKPSTRSRALCASLLALAALAVGAQGGSFAACDSRQRESGQEADEYTLKAAYVARFLKYVTWPPECFERPESPLVIAIVGRDPFGKALDKAVEGLEVHGRAVAVRRYPNLAAFREEQATVHFVFTSLSDKKVRATLFEVTARRPILVLGDEAGLASEGASMSFFLQEGKVRFEVNPKTVKAQGLTVGSQLLRLAKIVE